MDEAFLRRIDPSGDVGNDEEKRASQSGNSLPLPVKADARDLYNDRQSHQQVVKVLHGESFQNQSQRGRLGRGKNGNQCDDQQSRDGFLPVSPREAISDPPYMSPLISTLTRHLSDKLCTPLLDRRKDGFSVPVVPNGLGEAEDLVAGEHGEYDHGEPPEPWLVATAIMEARDGAFHLGHLITRTFRFLAVRGGEGATADTWEETA